MPARVGLQTKIVVLVIFIVSTVLFLSTYLSVRRVAVTMEEDVRERALMVAWGLGAGITAEADLADLRPLRREVLAVMRSRGIIEGIAVFLRTPEGLVSQVSTDRRMIRVLRPPAEKAVKRGRAVAELGTAGTARVWDVAVPLRIGDAVVGAVGVEVSLQRADALVAEQRQRALVTMGAAALVIVALLGWFLHRNVTRPIRAMVAAMTRAEGGDLGARAALRRRDELGRLAASFDRMLQRIADFNRELREEVAQATAALAVRNEELKRLHEGLFDLQRELARSDRLAALGQLAAMVAHEVGTPLHSISGHVKRLLGERHLDENTVHRLRIIDGQVARVVEILERFLATSHPAERAAEPVDVNALLRDLADLTGPTCEQKGVKVALDLAAALPRVRGHPGQLQQACLNLITNAIEAMPGGGQLTITTRWLSGDGLGGTPAASGTGEETGASGEPSGASRVEIAVADTGAGIPPADLDRIFEPFVTTKGMGEGTGLGLAICRRIVGAHGGTIRVSSAPGRGSTFTLALPARAG